MTSPDHQSLATSDREISDAISVLEKVPFMDVQRRGYHFQRVYFYSTLNDCEFLEKNRELWADREPGPAIDWNLADQLETAAQVADYLAELADIPDRHPSNRIEFCWQNPFWNNADALVHYGLLRKYKPKRVVEIGCGWSSLLMAKALERNGNNPQVTLVEPYPNKDIFQLLPKQWTHHHTILQRSPMDVFDSLSSGDICFYDGSHCVRTASDVNWFFFEVIPRLAPGVVIHLHDIFLPEAYPDPWVFESGQTWNEQYLLQAFLMYNPSFKILIANRYLWKKRGEELDKLYQGVQPSYGCSFWMQKLAK